MIKETSQDSNKESPDINESKKDEPKELSSDSKNINNINLCLKNLNIGLEQSDSPKKENHFVNKELNNKTQLESEDNLNNNKNVENSRKEKYNISPKEEKHIHNINNNKTKTPLKSHNSPLNFQLKKSANFQMKSRKNTYTENDFNPPNYNSLNIKSPIYSYYDQSQKFLSENYNGDNYLNYSENKNHKKTIEQEDNNNNKKIINEEISENHGLLPIKTEKSNEHDSESLNYNDFNLFMSPDVHNPSQVSGGLNNLQANKLSRKSSLGTASYNRENSQNKFLNSGGIG